MTLRELLESYGMLLDKSHCLARETAVCLRRAQENKANASHWRGKAELLVSESGRLNSLIEQRREQLIQMILSLPDDRESIVLELRYISLMGYRDISKAMRFSLRHVYRLHKRGVERLDALAEKNQC